MRALKQRVMVAIAAAVFSGIFPFEMPFPVIAFRLFHQT